MLHVFKHSKFISHAMASRHPGETGKKPEPEQESKRACSQKTRITAHGAPPQKLKPEPFPSFPRPVLHRIWGGHPSRNHGVHWAAGTYCLPNREYMPEKNPGQRPPVSRRARGVLCPGPRAGASLRPHRARRHAGHAGSSALGLLSGGTKERRTTGREKKISAARASCSGTCPPTV